MDDQREYLVNFHNVWMRVLAPDEYTAVKKAMACTDPNLGAFVLNDSSAEDDWDVSVSFYDGGGIPPLYYKIVFLNAQKDTVNKNPIAKIRLGVVAFDDGTDRLFFCPTGYMPKDRIFAEYELTYEHDKGLFVKHIK